MDIKAWLTDAGLPQYAGRFEEEQITPDLLNQLDHESLKQLGVDILGHRLMILRAARETALAKPARSGHAAAQTKASEWEAERRQLTILFCDMVGSTQISSQLDPEEFRDLIRLYHETVSDAARRAGGHVAQFLGDGSMIYFGYPAAQEDATERAVNMGLALIDALERLEPHPGLRLRTRIGIATGLVVVGDLVGRGLHEGAVVSGDAPNLAARLQAVAEPGQIVVGERTHQLLGRSFDSEPLAPMELKGIPGLTKAWRILGPSVSANRFEAHRSRAITPLIGRDREMTQLMEAWRKADAGQGSVVMLRGEAGLGKSRLLRELKKRSGMTGPALVQLHCSPYFSNTALHPVIRALEFGSGFKREDSPEVRLDKVLRFFGLDPKDAGEQGALIAGLMGLPADRFPPLEISVGLQRTRLFEAMLGLIMRAARSSPVMLFFEDLHWADPTTLQLVARMIETAPAGRVLVVGTYRPEFEPPWGSDAGVMLCDLQRLEETEVQELISFLAQDGGGLPPDVIATLAARADGIPFFAEELTRSVIEMDSRTVNTVPTTLRDTLMAQLDSLEGPRPIAQIASVIGREFDIDLLGAVSRKSRASLLRSLEDLVEANLIFAGREPGTWVFRHALIRDSAYESLLNRSRQSMHLSIARAIEEVFPDRARNAPEFPARHYAEAGEHASAARNWLAAGQSARQRGIVSEAKAHMQAGLEQVAQMPRGPDREALEVQLHAGHGAVLSGIKGHAAPEVGAAFAKARALDAAGTSKDFQIAFQNGYGAHLAMRGEVANGHRELSRIAEIAGDDPRLLVSAGSALSWSHYSCGNFETSVWWGEQAEGHVKGGAWNSSSPRHTTGDPLVIARCWHAASLWALGKSDQATAMTQAALDHAETLNDPYSVIYAQVNGLCRLAALQGRSDAVLQITTDAVAYAKRMGYDFAAGYSLFWQAEALAATGEPEKALQIIGAAISVCKAMSFRLHEPHFLGMQAVMLAQTGDTAAAFAALDGLEAQVDESGELWIAPDVRIARARVAEAAGDTDTALAAWQDALARARALSSPAWALRAATGLADLMARKGQQEAAHTVLSPVYRGFTEGFDTADLARAKGVLDRLGADRLEPSGT
ncbi:adenylate/guanylate cyclase domain-containing protein [Sedimentitalea sp. JM2-8]|uniref:Adenylate/guanylate cyclase domain-containing protein n=1 Tax=Sedimentitalea xiamensis TaxID=3050037 RepID=A0ABT7FGF6_9RHOB|nr:adenylate/guanylate cyclase domain-containing protein [Sedimentitalea xiamensis]MDK3074158.1 adenylate/guanylate cyclase domain-containing protein [Sedimentitalea xiamensis]